MASGETVLKVFDGKILALYLYSNWSQSDHPTKSRPGADHCLSIER
jgi:hypothetical protein